MISERAGIAGSDLDPPWRVQSIFACVVKTDDVTGGIEEPGLPPQPGLIPRFLRELYSLGLEPPHLFVERGALEVDNGLGRFTEELYGMKRKGRAAHRCLEPGVMRRVDDDLETHLFVERDRCGEIRCWKGDLIEFHAISG